MKFTKYLLIESDGSMRLQDKVDTLELCESTTVMKITFSDETLATIFRAIKSRGEIEPVILSLED